MDQVIANVIVAAAAYLLVGLGFSLVYTTTRFFHFAHGIVVTLGAYVAFTLRVWTGLPLWASLLGGVMASGLAGVGMELVVYRPLRKRGGSSAALLLVSLGLYAGTQAAITLIFGAGTQTFRAGEVPEGLAVLGTRVTGPQIALVGVSAACSLSAWLAMRRTDLGKMVRAVASDPDLAYACGVDSGHIALVVFWWSSILAGLAGVLLAYDSDLSPMMGFRPLMLAAVAVIVGGIGSIPGIALGAFLIALAQNLGAWWISSRWEDPIAFLILITFLFLRPQGFLGTLLRKTVA